MFFKDGQLYNPEYLSEIPDEDFDRIMQININGTFYAIRAPAPLIKAIGGGAIVNFAAVAGLDGTPVPAYYPTSKAAIVGMTRSIQHSLQRPGGSRHRPRSSVHGQSFRL